MASIGFFLIVPRRTCWSGAQHVQSLVSTAIRIAQRPRTTFGTIFHFSSFTLLNVDEGIATRASVPWTETSSAINITKTPTLMTFLFVPGRVIFLRMMNIKHT
jgi:hypothetical protein